MGWVVVSNLLTLNLDIYTFNLTDWQQNQNNTDDALKSDNLPLKFLQKYNW